MKKFVLFLVIMSAFLLFHSCKKSNSNRATNISIDADLLKAFSYKIGTYWVYKDSITNQIDSFYVTKNTFSSGPSYSTPNSPYTFDKQTILINDYNENKSHIDVWEMTLYSNCIQLIWFKGFSTQDYYYDFYPLTTYPFTVGGLSVPGGQSTDISNTEYIIQSYSLNGKLYNNTAEFYHTYVYAGDTEYFDRFYMNADVGLIKLKFADSYDTIYKTWELLRYNVSK